MSKKTACKIRSDLVSLYSNWYIKNSDLESYSLFLQPRDWLASLLRHLPVIWFWTQAHVKITHWNSSSFLTSIVYMCFLLWNTADDTDERLPEGICLLRNP